MAQNKNGVYGEDGASFEQSFQRLQEVVKKLSEGSLTLEEALSSFEEGMALADRCTQMLGDAELRLRQVSARASRAGEEAVGRLEEVRTSAQSTASAAPRTAAEDLDDIDEAIRQSPLIDEDDEIVSVHIESYERRIVRDVPQNQQAARPPAGSAAGSWAQPAPGGSAYSGQPQGQRPVPQPPGADALRGRQPAPGAQNPGRPGAGQNLDPLFDEEE
jgi:exodeoxyribonuclease VII small subunit